jgi:hypothetical protein
VSRPRTPLEDRFWAKVERWGPDACWPYRGHLRSDGYGDFNGELAHRVAFRISKGDPGDLEVQHLSECTSRLCCNPSHLVTTKRRSAGGRPPTKLTEAAAAAIVASPLPAKTLAAQYDTSPAYIYRVRSGARWAGATAQLRRLRDGSESTDQD